MASLSEMMDYANFTSKNSPIGEVNQILQGGIQGYAAGVEKKKSAQAQQLDTMLKLLDISEKQQKIEMEKRKMQIQDNMMKAMGSIPLGDGEHSNFMNSVWNGVGSDNPKYVNTPGSKMAKMSNDVEYLPGWSVSGDGNSTMTMKPHFKKDASGKGTTVKGAAGDKNAEANLQAKIYKMAQTSAQADYVKSLDEQTQNRINKGLIKPPPAPPDFVQKYISAADTYYRKGAKEYSKLFDMGKGGGGEPQLSNDPKSPNYSGHTGKFEKPLKKKAPEKVDIWSGTPTDETETDTETDDPDL